MAARPGKGQSRTPAQAPGTMGGLCRVPRPVSTAPPCPQLPVPSLPPWLPPIAAKAPLHPRVPCREDGTDLCGPDVSLPPEEIPAPRPGTARSAPAPGAPGAVSPPRLAPFARLRADTPPQVPAGTAEAEQGPLPRPSHGPLGLVDLAFEPGGQDSAPAPSHPVSCPVAPPVHVAIIRVSVRPEARAAPTPGRAGRGSGWTVAGNAAPLGAPRPPSHAAPRAPSRLP